MLLNIVFLGDKVCFHMPVATLLDALWTVKGLLRRLTAAKRLKTHD